LGQKGILAVLFVRHLTRKQTGRGTTGSFSETFSVLSAREVIMVSKIHQSV
jgi:orotate phosphoribosyltransferase-like protein